ncbi:unnamed protein product [Dibothriocephalus latus]|uniref:Uncharacterized protein n=1 Tax=Dibothriocephalus latus TaxID=60516 RepID=A0A3P7LUF2_DIBLA|nr:unnamed protein product [Dibothriocephalus latus]
MAPFNPYFIPHPAMLPPHSVYHYPCEFLSGPPQFKPTASFTEEECAAIVKVLSKIAQPKSIQEISIEVWKAASKKEMRYLEN